MTPEKQRIAIAEACGHGDYSTRMNGWHDNDIAGLPNYLNDLNAMHTAESTIRKDHDKWGIYLVQLSRTAPECRVFATPAQRAEAFLKTLNLWK